MALVSHRSTSTNETQQLDDALRSFRSVLSDNEHQELLKKTSLPDADAVLIFTAELDARNLNRKGRSIASNLFTVLQSVRDFSNIVGTFISAHPEIAALVWGSIQLTTLVLTNFLSYYETASKLFIEFGRLCPIFKDYEGLFPTSTKLRAALCGFHASIIRFCKHLVEVLRRPWTQRAIHSLWESFEQEFQSDRDDIRAHSKNVKNEISFAKAQADSEDQTQNKKSRFLLSRFAQRTEAGIERIDRRRAYERRQKLLDKLSTHDHLTPLKQSRRKTCPGSTEWAFQTAEFATWFDGSGPPLLWCSGKIGSGKTVLSASIIDRVLTYKDNSKVLVAFYFLRFDDQKSLLAETAIRSILLQMLEPENLSEDEEEKLRSALSGSTTDVANILCARIKGLKGCYIVIDGIDEFEKQERNELFNILFNLVSRTSNTRLFISGRESFSQEIKTKFPSLQNISMRKSPMSSSMELYVDSLLEAKLENEDLVVGSPDLVVEIKNALLKGADGMFLWIMFQVDEICSQHCDEDIRSTINGLPKDLTEVFNRALCRIVSHKNAEIAQKSFRWIGGMQRPPYLNELREIILVEIGQKDSISGRICNDVHRIASWCENLVVVDEELELVQFGHHSIQEFLLQKSSVDNLQNFHFDLEEATHYIGEICITYLNFNDFKTTLARRPKPIPPITPADIPGKVFGRPVAKVFRMTARSSRSKATAVDITDNLSSFARSGAATDSERLSSSHPFLAYAKENWAFHTAQFQEKRSKSWPLWENMMLDGHQLAGSPWGNTPFTATCGASFDWAMSQRHLALLRLIMKVRSFSQIKKETAEQLLFDMEDEEKLEMILDSRNFHDSWTIPVLTAAVESGNKDIIEKLVAAGAFLLHDQSPSKSLPIFVELGYADIVDNLLKAGAKANLPVDVNGYTTLQTATRYGHANVIEKLLADGADLNACSKHGTALVVAAVNGHADIIDKLLVAGADVNAIGGQDGTALQAAAFKGYTDIIDKLLADGADVNACNEQGTALEVAAVIGHADIIDKLLAAGADVNAIGGRYGTALQAATFKGHTDIIDKLLAAGADVNAISGMYSTALEAAAFNGYTDIIDKLLVAGADVSAISGQDSTALQAAAFKGHTDIIDKLLAARADVNAIGGRYGTALQAAAFNGYTDIIDKLLVARADVNAIGGRYGTALQAAAFEGHTDIIDKLLAAGADVNAISGMYSTALQVAVRYGHRDIVKKLRAAGAKK